MIYPYKFLFENINQYISESPFLPKKLYMYIYMFSIFYTLLHIFLFLLLKIYSGYHFTSTYRHLSMTTWYSIVRMFFPTVAPTFRWAFCDYKKSNFSSYFWRCISNKIPRSEITGSKDKGICSFSKYFQIPPYRGCTFCIPASKCVTGALSKSLANRRCAQIYKFLWC